MPIVLVRPQVDCESCIQYLQGIICSSSPRCEHVFGESLLWEQMKTMSLDQEAV